MLDNWKGLLKETLWIHRLGTVTPSGLNSKIIYLCLYSRYLLLLIFAFQPRFSVNNLYLIAIHYADFFTPTEQDHALALTSFNVHSES